MFKNLDSKYGKIVANVIVFFVEIMNIQQWGGLKKGIKYIKVLIILGYKYLCNWDITIEFIYSWNRQNYLSNDI